MVNAFVVYFVFSGSDFLGFIFSLTEAERRVKAKLWNLSGIWAIIFNFSNFYLLLHDSHCVWFPRKLRK
jgi:hypothetical protein